MTTAKSTTRNSWPPSLETPEAIANLRAGAIALCQPVNSPELFAVERLEVDRAMVSPAKSAFGSPLFRHKSQSKRLDRRASEDFMRLQALRREIAASQPGKLTNEAKNEAKKRTYCRAEAKENTAAFSPEEKIRKAIRGPHPNASNLAPQHRPSGKFANAPRLGAAAFACRAGMNDDTAPQSLRRPVLSSPIPTGAPVPQIAAGSTPRHAKPSPS